MIEVPVDELHPGPGRSFLRDSAMDKSRIMGAVARVAKKIIDRSGPR